MHWRWIGCLLAIPLIVGFPTAAFTQQLNGFDLPEHGRTGVFSPGLIQGYGENQVIPFKANVDPVDLEDAAVRAAAEGSASQYLITVMIPTFSDHAPPRPSEANGMSECLFGVPVGGAYPHAASVPNYKDLDNAEAPAKGLLGKGGQFVFGVVKYQPKFDQWSSSKTIGTINLVVDRFALGHPDFPNGVTGLQYDVHFDLAPAEQKGGGKKGSLPAATIQFGARLAASGLPAITPTGGGTYPGACSFHPGPGLLHVAYEVLKPTGRSTVPLICTFAGGGGGGGRQRLIEVEGLKWCDAAVDHTYDPVNDTTIAGVVVELRDGSCDGEVLDADTTGADGTYHLMTTVDVGADAYLYVVEDSAGAGETLDAASWAQTTPQNDCTCNPIIEDIFAVGTGVFCETLLDVQGDVLLSGRNFGNLKMGEVGERTPGFWCSQVHLERDGQGGSEPCQNLINTCAPPGEGNMVIDRVNRAIEWWKGFCPAGANIFDLVPGVDGAPYDHDEAAAILCPQEGEAEHYQFERHLLALLLNVTDCPCVGEPCGKVGSELCLDQPINLNGYLATVGDALAGACDGSVGKDVLAGINENSITIQANCGF